MKIRLVADTNILVSHFLLPGHNPSKIIHLALEDKLNLVLSEFILAEMEGVLQKKLRFTRAETLAARKSIESITEMVKPRHAVDIIQADESDNRILECALSGKAHVIVTGDKKHLLPVKEFKGIKILSPVEFLKAFVE